MAQSGFTPIITYNSGTTTTVPTAGNLANGELALNYADGKLFYKDSGGVVQVLASKSGNVNVSSFSAGTTGFTPSTATTGAVTLAGTLATTNGGTGLTSFTANGVVYASSTSALATGSALTFDGTNLGVGTPSPTYKLNVVSGSGSQNIFQAGQSGVSNGYTIISNGTNLTHQWYNGGSEAMRISTSGNLGIGTNSPSAPLEIVKSNATGIAVSSGATYPLNAYGATTGQTTFAIANSGGTSYFGVENSSGGTFTGSTAYATIVGPSGARPLQLVTNNTVQATLDSSGNLGLGVTPSAWSGTGAKGLQVGTALSLGYSNSAGSFVGGNTYWGGDWKRITTGAATAYLLGGDGTHLWYQTATSSSANSTISFNQAMTLDNSGSLLVGLTSKPNDAKLAVNGSVYVNNAPYGIGQFAVGSYAVTSVFANSGYGFSAISFGRYDGAGTYSPQVLIDPSGNVGIGTSSPGYQQEIKGSSAQVGITGTGTASNYLTVGNTNASNGFYVGQDNSAGTNFNTGVAYGPVLWTQASSQTFVTNSGSNIMTYSSGNLLVGTTSAGSYLGSGNIVSPGVFTSYQGYVLCGYPGTTDIYTFANGYSGVFLISGRQSGAPNGGIYALALITVGTGTGTLSVASLTNASCIFGVSGTARTVNLLNTAGGSLGLSFSIIRLNAS